MYQKILIKVHYSKMTQNACKNIFWFYTAGNISLNILFFFLNEESKA